MTYNPRSTEETGHEPLADRLLHPPPDPTGAIERIAEATRFEPQFQGRIYLVGGSLRDYLLGRWSGDLDLVVEGDALAAARLLYDKGHSSIRPVTYERFGTAMIVVNSHQVELITARSESYHEASRKPSVTPATILEDALRRDFTINTLLWNIHAAEWTDPTGGAVRDLKLGLIRTPLDPDRTFFDDPLRMLRAVRFAAQLGFMLSPEVAASIAQHAGRLAVISRERIRDEWNKIILSTRPALGLTLLHDLGLLGAVSPEVQHLYATPSLWSHTLELLNGWTAAGRDRPAPLGVRLAGVLHHTAVPAAAARILRGMRYAGTEASDVSLLLTLRLFLTARPVHLASDGDVRRFIRTAGPLLEDALFFCESDQLAGDIELRDVPLGELRSRIDDLERRVASCSLDSPLSGQEIMTLLSLRPGPEIKEAKQWLLDEVLEGRLQPGDQDLARQRLVERWSGPDRR